MWQTADKLESLIRVKQCRDCPQNEGDYPKLLRSDWLWRASSTVDRTKQTGFICLSLHHSSLFQSISLIIIKLFKRMVTH